MPIKPENRARYPKDWKRIADAIRERAGQRCEGSPVYPDCRAPNGEPHPVTGSRVVLTVAHLDHTPENCEAHNLKAMCQRCHLTYDAEHHKANAYRTRKALRQARCPRVLRRGGQKSPHSFRPYLGQASTSRRCLLVHSA